MHLTIASLAGLLPVVFVACAGLALRVVLGRRAAVVVACALGGVVTVVITEVLSLAVSLSRGPVTVLWAVAAGVAAFRAYRSRQKAVPRESLRSWLGGRDSVVLWAAVVFILLLTLATALLAAPNTWDAVTYHMARVAHWEQNRSLSYYPTHNLRQLHLAPFAEYAILQLQLLTGTDVFANLVQWASVLGAAVAASLIALHVGAGRQGQILAGFMVLSIPMAVAQASSAQTDAVVMLWLLAFVALANESEALARWPLPMWLVLGACLGLAALTKATAYIYGLPIVIWFVVKHARSFAGPKALAVIAATALVLNLGFFARNWRFEGTPLGSGREDTSYTNETHGPRSVLSNLIRNLGPHVGTPSHRINVAIDSTIQRSMRKLGMDPNDPRTTWSGGAFSVGFGHDDGVVGNPLQLILLTVCFALILFKPGFRRTADERDLALCVLGGYLLFCAILKWQPWHSRLHLPLFGLAAPIVATVAARHFGNLMIGGLAAILALGSLAMPLFDVTRPVRGQYSVFRVSREDSYLSGNPKRFAGLGGTMDRLSASGCRNLGLISHGDGAEYVIWAWAARRLPEMPRIENVNVTNESAVFANNEPFRSFQPCAIVTLDDVVGPSVQVHGQTFNRTEPPAGGVSLYLPATRF